MRFSNYILEELISEGIVSNISYLHPSNRQFTFRDTEVNEGQSFAKFISDGQHFGNLIGRVADVSHRVAKGVTGATRRIADFGDKGREFTDKIMGATGDIARGVAIRTPHGIKHVADHIADHLNNPSSAAHFHELALHAAQLFA